MSAPPIPAPPHPHRSVSLLRFSSRFHPADERRTRLFVETLPIRLRSPIDLDLKPKLTIQRRRLLSGEDVGTAVHAATFIRQRRMVLEAELLDDIAYFDFVLAHELFHFVWASLGNPHRKSWASLLKFQAGTDVSEESVRQGLSPNSANPDPRVGQGQSLHQPQVAPLLAEIGESSSVALESWLERPTSKAAWKNYVCESFCDTTAAMCSPPGVPPGYQLDQQLLSARREWFANAIRASHWLC